MRKIENTLLCHEKKEAIGYHTRVYYLIGISSRDTEAGSNPREYQGLNMNNKKIIESIIKYCTSYFWSLHSGISLTTTGGKKRENNSSDVIFEYDDACCTNGLQTLSLIRVLVGIKIYQENNVKNEIVKKINSKSTETLKKYMLKTFSEETVEVIFSHIDLKDINNVLSWMHKAENQEIMGLFYDLSLEDLLNMELPIHVKILDEIAGIDQDLRKFGLRVANANNDTQKVKVDDKFGTKYEEWLRINLFKGNTIKVENNSIPVQFRYNSTKENPSIFLSDALRLIIATTILTDKESEEISVFLSNKANRTETIYNFFEKIINAQKEDDVDLERALDVVRNLLPGLVRLRFFIENLDREFRSNLEFQDIKSWAKLGVYKSYFYEEKGDSLKKEEDIQKAIKKIAKIPINTLMTLLIFSIKNYVHVNERNEVKFELETSNISEEDLWRGILKNIYSTYFTFRAQNIHGSTSDLLRSSTLYEKMEESASVLLEILGVREKGNIALYRFSLKKENDSFT